MEDVGGAELYWCGAVHRHIGGSAGRLGEHQGAQLLAAQHPEVCAGDGADAAMRQMEQCSFATNFSRCELLLNPNHKNDITYVVHTLHIWLLFSVRLMLFVVYEFWFCICSASF